MCRNHFYFLYGAFNQILMGWFLCRKILFKANIYLQQKCFHKLFYVWDTASAFKRLQQKYFCCDQMKKSPRVAKALIDQA